MTTTSSRTDGRGGAPATEGDRTRIDPTWAGWGGLVFVALVVVQNVIRGASAPQNDADAAELLRYFSEHRGLEVALTASFVVGGLGLSVFLGGLMARLAGGPQRAWAYTGLLGAAGVVALFSVMVGVEAALVAVARAGGEGVATLWALHNGVFAVLDLSIAIALLGLGCAAAAEGLAPRAFRWLAPVGAALLAVGAAGAPLEADGSSMVPMGPALVGFLLWLVFVAVTGARLRRG